MRTRIKICGITRAPDADAAVAHGADAIGFIFWKPSERCIGPELAGKIAARLPAFVTPVGVFVNPEREDVERFLERCTGAALQFHGEESPQFCAQFGRAWIKATRARPELDLIEYFTPYRKASAWLIDAFHDRVYGGSGTSFDWGKVPANLAKPMILSGGLTVDNVAEAIRRLRPYAVDVSSGVESAKGIKEAAKIAAFVAGVRHADA